MFKRFIFILLSFVLPLSVRGIVRVSKFIVLFPGFREPSLPAKAAADRRTLIPTIATLATSEQHALQLAVERIKRKQTFSFFKNADIYYF